MFLGLGPQGNESLFSTYYSSAALEIELFRQTDEVPAELTQRGGDPATAKM